jgi:exosortase family protein XrtG
MGFLWLWILFFIWLAVVLFLRFYHIWLPYYVLGAVGGAYWLVIGINALGLELEISSLVASTVSAVSNVLGISAKTFDNAPGLLLVLVVTQNVGWTVLQVGVESSGLLEMATLTSLLVFYPGWSNTRRFFSVLIGILATWGANIIRMMLIVVLLNELGKPVLVVAHTFIGKAVFFSITVIIYWVLITRPTIRIIERLLQRKNVSVKYHSV